MYKIIVIGEKHDFFTNLTLIILCYAVNKVWGLRSSANCRKWNKRNPTLIFEF